MFFVGIFLENEGCE